MSNVSNFTNTSIVLPIKWEITWDKIAVAVILYSITLVTILGNILVLIAVRIEKKLQTIFNYYIVNLAITDVAVAVMAMSFMATHTVLGYWPFGEILCAIWILFDYGMTFVSVFTLILISVDRFWSVTWSVTYREYHTKRKCIISIICVWLFMIVLWVPPWIVDRIRYSEPGMCYWDPSLNKEFVFIIAILGHHGPFCIMIFCYAHVFKFMRKRARAVDSRRMGEPRKSWKLNIATVSDVIESDACPSTSVQQIGTDIIQHVDTFSQPNSYLQVPGTSASIVANRSVKHSRNRLVRDKVVFVTLTYIIAGYVILWLPFHIVFDISIVYPTLVPDQVLYLAFWMAYFNSTLNPVLYNFSSPEFRRAYKRILDRLKCR